MSNTPFCNIRGTVLPGNPKAPGLQPIPKATDMNSIIKALEALTNNYNYLQQMFNSGKGDYFEDRNLRTTTVTRVYDRTDQTKQTYVDVAQITGAVFVNPITGQRLIWKQ